MQLCTNADYPMRIDQEFAHRATHREHEIASSRCIGGKHFKELLLGNDCDTATQRCFGSRREVEAYDLTIALNIDAGRKSAAQRDNVIA
jgi:hypothetical protein